MNYLKKCLQLIENVYNYSNRVKATKKTNSPLIENKNVEQNKSATQGS